MVILGGYLLATKQVLDCIILAFNRRVIYCHQNGVLNNAAHHKVLEGQRSPKDMRWVGNKEQCRAEVAVLAVQSGFLIGLDEVVAAR